MISKKYLMNVIEGGTVKVLSLGETAFNAIQAKLEEIRIATFREQNIRAAQRRFKQSKMRYRR